MNLPPETSLRLFEEGGTLVFLGVPVGTEVGIDMESWNTGEKFRGIKMIPPGLHFIHFSTVGKDGISQAPRTGFFHDFKKGEIICKKYDKKTEDISITEQSEEDLEALRLNIKELDRYLGAYPYPSWRKWISLSNKITGTTATRLAPIGGRICSAPELSVDSDQSVPVPQASKRMTKLEIAESLLPQMSEVETCKIRYTDIPSHLYDASTSASDVTQHNMDWSLKLEVVIQLSGGVMELLGELQFAFVCFLVAQNYNSFEQWKSLIKLICYSYAAIEKYPNLFIDFVSDLYFQMDEVQSDLFTDIVTQNNFIYSCLKRLFDNIRETGNVDSRLQGKAQRFQNFLEAKFHWEFEEQEDDEDLPVIVSESGDY